MTRDQLLDWIDRYERAWRTPGTDALRALFAEEATYRTAPFEIPFRGLAAISQFWEAGRDGPDEEFTMGSEIVAVEGDTGVARVEVRYGATDSRYRDIWIVRLDQSGRCVHFEEWPFWPPGQKGGWDEGPPQAS
ncbi:MAG TPA: nuclear transport factor 2 family protein [Thermoleophilaceae bacterium]|nr:nuclear transport factor 2 family protein [Thermoleophilaceae bacterium]